MTNYLPPLAVLFDDLLIWSYDCIYISWDEWSNSESSVQNVLNSRSPPNSILLPATCVSKALLLWSGAGGTEEVHLMLITLLSWANILSTIRCPLVASVTPLSQNSSALSKHLTTSRKKIESAQHQLVYSPLLFSATNKWKALLHEGEHERTSWERHVNANPLSNDRREPKRPWKPCRVLPEGTEFDFPYSCNKFPTVYSPLTPRSKAKKEGTPVTPLLQNSPPIRLPCSYPVLSP